MVPGTLILLQRFLLGKYFSVRPVIILLPVICRIRCYFEFCSLPQRLLMDFLMQWSWCKKWLSGHLLLWLPQMLLRKFCFLAFSPLAELLFALKQKLFSQGSENHLPLPAQGFSPVEVCLARDEQRRIPCLLSFPKKEKKTQQTQIQNIVCVQLGVDV